MKILIADDEPDCRLWLQTFLAKLNLDVVTCKDGLTAWNLLQSRDPPKIALLDWMMPGMDGLQVCQAVRKQADRPYTYLLLLTAKNRKTDLLRGFQAGADDYLCKPIDEDELRGRLLAGQRILAWQDELISVREQLRIQATRDGLTGLWNRHAISDLLKKELQRARRENQSVGLGMIDLDHFKRINDTFGHQAGDTVLREVGKRLTALLRPYDLVSRYGGEEFLVVLPGCDESNALKLCERLREGLAAVPVQFEGNAIAATASIGVAMASIGVNFEAEELLRISDRALYRAKAGGRNRVELGTE